jgi:hypothetical protein
MCADSSSSHMVVVLLHMVALACRVPLCCVSAALHVICLQLHLRKAIEHSSLKWLGCNGWHAWFCKDCAVAGANCHASFYA